MSKLFGKALSTITELINNAFKDGELDEESNVGKIDIANSDREYLKSINYINKISNEVKKES